MGGYGQVSQKFNIPLKKEGDSLVLLYVSSDTLGKNGWRILSNSTPTTANPSPLLSLNPNNPERPYDQQN